MIKILCNAALQDNPAFLTFAKTLPQTFDSLGEIVHDARNQLRKVEVADWKIPDLPKVMIKRYHGLFFFQRVWYTFFRSPKCRRAYDNTVELRRRGLPAAEEVACVEVWTHGLFKYGFFISKVGEGERMDYLVVRLQQHGKQQTIDALIHQFAELTSAVHQCGVLYKDLNCGNVLCQQTMSMTAWNFTLIDTNRALFSDHPLTLNESLPDIILMNPIMGTVEQFIGEYLLLRGCYSEDEVARIRRLQYLRHERRRPFKEYFKRFKKFYYRWLAR